jgi:hypothetical protein
MAGLDPATQYGTTTPYYGILAAAPTRGCWVAASRAAMVQRELLKLV